jgi:hypothetical protein
LTLDLLVNGLDGFLFDRRIKGQLGCPFPWRAQVLTIEGGFDQAALEFDLGLLPL